MGGKPLTPTKKQGTGKMETKDEYRDKYILAQLVKTLRAKDENEKTKIYNETMQMLREGK